MFIAWANDLGVKIYDTSSQQRITYINRPKDSPRPDMYLCRLFWKNDETLFIGWADSIKVGTIHVSLYLALMLCQVGTIKEKPRDTREGSTEKLPSRYVELIARFTTDFWICGLAPLGDNIVRRS